MVNQANFLIYHNDTDGLFNYMLQQGGRNVKHIIRN